METFVLILLVISGPGHVTSQTADFGGKAACEAAGNAAVATMSRIMARNVYYICAQKNGVGQ